MSSVAKMIGKGCRFLLTMSPSRGQVESSSAARIAPMISKLLFMSTKMILHSNKDLLQRIISTLSSSSSSSLLGSDLANSVRFCCEGDTNDEIAGKQIQLLKVICVVMLCMKWSMTVSLPEETGSLCPSMMTTSNFVVKELWEAIVPLFDLSLKFVTVDNFACQPEGISVLIAMKTCEVMNRSLRILFPNSIVRLLCSKESSAALDSLLHDRSSELISVRVIAAALIDSMDSHSPDSQCNSSLPSMESDCDVGQFSILCEGLFNSLSICYFINPLVGNLRVYRVNPI